MARRGNSREGDPMPSRLNLKNIAALLVDRDPFARGLVAQMLRGFGISTILIADNGEEAKGLLAHHAPEITFIEGELPDMAAGELLQWIRTNPNKAVRYLPVIVLSGYTQLSLISAARAAGAHLVVRKPVSPQTLFDRLVWVAGFDRPFLESPTYTGPDRRFHAVAPPDGEMKRETEDPQPVILQA
jgi:CheY-like chemotaxis protein